MDLTAEFQQLVQEIQKRPSLDEPSTDKNRILKPSKTRKNIFETKALAIVENICRLREFLTSNRKAYIDIAIDMDHSISRLTDVERDKIDAGANKFIQTINQLIANFKSDLKQARHLKAQQTQHLEAVCDILETFLRVACRMYSEQKAIRVEREVEFQKLSRLELNARSSKRQQTEKEEKISETSESEDQEEGNSGELQPEVSASAWTPSEEEEETYEMTPEEEQMLKQENEVMYEDLIRMRDDVEKIESKVVKIAELQEFFTEKILEQKEVIDHISTNAISTTENVKDGNEELRKAIQRNASIRVYILFFLLVMSFSLLFLDWYNE